MPNGGILLTACVTVFGLTGPTGPPALAGPPGPTGPTGPPALAGPAAPVGRIILAEAASLTGPAAPVVLTGPPGLTGPAVPAAPAVSARAAYLVDTTTGTAHFGKEATRRMPVASLAKIMTAYVVLREARLTDLVTVKAGDVAYARRNDATDASLRAGERLTVKDLLHGAMLPSGADATHALARVYGPGQKRFVAKMNATARSLGLADTVYTNADGLPRPRGGHSTAADQVRLSDLALRHPVLSAIASTERYVVRRTAAHRRHVWTNTNELLGAPGVLGVKTGYTGAAGYCLAFAADRDGHRLVGVLLGETRSKRRFQTAGRLLDWAERLIEEAPVPNGPPPGGGEPAPPAPPGGLPDLPALDSTVL
ncbi:D-alanyl-D-alanine carboxypeptidase family protein [Planomonospora sp. ID91781]|uniref:D-alanyl-D-alanine carboxypeptidase family protein n=1 Tax=Planomonospora sp. ID91781 TaxID=2738135 RepID=UPI001E555C8D|nr:serine hydrolase [Planomonospora sp. ID91781]